MTTRDRARESQPLVRLNALPQRAPRLEVDRTFPGRVGNAAILTTGPALGHGFEVDRTTVEQVARYAAGLRGRWTHGGVSEDGLGRHLGRWEQARVESVRLCRACGLEAAETSCASCGGESTEAHRAVGDFVFAKSAWELRPDGLDVPAPAYLMDRALEDPESLGISIVARLTYDEVKGKGGEVLQRLARLAARRDLCRADWVADPAANPIGLHQGTGTTSEVVELATQELDRVVEREGLERAKAKALGFLARYFGDDLGAAEELARLEEEVGSLVARVSELMERADRCQARASEAFLERLRRESAAAQAPIKETDMERVAALLRAGQAEAALAMGEAFLAQSKAQNQVAFQRGDALSLAPGDEPGESSIQVQARLLRQRGWTVELNQDGKAFTAAPPGRS